MGLRTGDVSINPGAAVMIMTTEILRNISYRALLEGDPLSGFAPNLDDVALTVLDEVHYLGHADRGSVWEEIVINCPPHMKLLAMSATVANPEEIGSWISSVHGTCETVTTSFRPVPLKWWFAWEEGGGRRRRPRGGRAGDGDGYGGGYRSGSESEGSGSESGGEPRMRMRGRSGVVHMEALLERRRKDSPMRMNMMLDRSAKAVKRLRGQMAAVRRKMLRARSKRTSGYDELKRLQERTSQLENVRAALRRAGHERARVGRPPTCDAHACVVPVYAARAIVRMHVCLGPRAGLERHRCTACCTAFLCAAWRVHSMHRHSYVHGLVHSMSKYVEKCYVGSAALHAGCCAVSGVPIMVWSVKEYGMVHSGYGLVSVWVT